MRVVMAITRALRNIRAEFNLSPAATVHAIMLVESDAIWELLQSDGKYIETMAKSQLEMVRTLAEKPKHAVSALTTFAEIYVPLEGIIDIAKEIGRLEKELKAVEIDLTKAEGKLNNPTFVSKAPDEVIAKEKGKAEEARSRKEGILQRLQILQA